MKFELIYGNNVFRERLCVFECEYEERYAVAKEKLAEAGISYNNEKGKFWETEEGKFFYLEIIALNNAAGLFSKNGFTFEIHSDEAIHDNSPHVHVWREGKEITVRLGSYKVKKNKNFKENDVRAAIKIIKQYEQQFYEAWNAIIIEHDICKAYKTFENV